MHWQSKVGMHQFIHCWPPLQSCKEGKAVSQLKGAGKKNMVVKTSAIDLPILVRPVLVKLPLSWWARKRKWD
jgi:hypothetical protein